MATDDPPYLIVGTDVSAKYKGAFCEAKIKKANKVVKCKVVFKNGLGTHMVTDDQIKGPLRLGSEVEARHPEKNQMLEAVINKMQDYSQYTVVFDDGDETTLRRTSLCLKSGRHFAESPTLDQFPLTNPEHFSTPVIGTSKFKRKRRSTMNSSLLSFPCSDFESSDDESVQRRVQAIRDKEHNPDLGRVVCVDFGDRRKKDNWYPGLIVPPHASGKVNKEEHLVRSFKDGKYYQVPKRDIRDFVRDSIPKVENNALKTAIEKAFNYMDKDELPPHWEKALFACLDVQSADEDSRDSYTDTSDDEPSEEKDRFVAQLYKFMDERGTPINKAPTVSNRDLNLYRLFKIVHKLGGYNKVTNKNKWKVVYIRMGLPASNPNGPNQIKIAYKRFLQSFEDFYRKLGCTMVSNSRSTRGRHRSDRNFIITRTRDRESPKGRKNSKEPKEKAPAEKKIEEKPKLNEKKDSDSSSKSEEKIPKTPEKKRVDKSLPRSEEKERKKPEEKPRLVRSQSLTKDKKDSPKAKEKEVVEKARTREDARKEKNESPEKKGTRSSSKAEPTPKKEEPKKEKPAPKDIAKKEEPKSDAESKAKTGGGPKKEEKKLKEKIKPEKRKDEKLSPKEAKSSRRAEDKSPKRKAKKEEQRLLPDTPKREMKVKREEASDDEMASVDVEEEGKESSSQEEGDRKGPPGRGKGEDGEEPPNKGKRRSIKAEDKDDKESLCDMSDSDDESLPTDSEKDLGKEVEVGDRVKVKYGRGRMQKVYEAKVLKIEVDSSEKRYYVHYAGWNTRYDEWVKKSYIVANISGKPKDNTKSTSPSSAKKVDRGRPPGVLANTRKNSTGSLRSTRSEKRSPATSTRESRTRPGKEAQKDPDGTSDEELFSDDDGMDKGKPDLAEIEKAIAVDESQDVVPVVKEESKAEEPEPEPVAPPVVVKEEDSGTPPVIESSSAKSEEEVVKEKCDIEEEVKSGVNKEVSPADLSLTSSNSPSESAASSTGRFPPAEESKSALSFAGLIKKEPSPKPSQSESAFMALMEGDKVSFDSNKSFKSSPPIFDDDLNSPQNSESASTTSKEKFDPKSISNLFDSILKQPSDNDSNDVSKSSTAEVASKALEDSEKGDPNASCSENQFSLESSKNTDLSKEMSKAGASTPSKNAVVSNDSKSKDNFDMLLQQSSSFRPEPRKESDSKDDIFSFTFSPHNTSKDNMASDQPFSNQPLTDSLYPKPTETVDVSKMIPGILERLKKDVVADVSDSPPPPKEELNFDFLRGTQSVSKSLSRSDSSNSLRICESDTNDSNVESKDSLVSERVEVSLDASISQDEKLSCPAPPVTTSSSNAEPPVMSNDESNVNKEEDSIVETQKAAEAISESDPPNPEPEVPLVSEPPASEPVASPVPEESSISKKEEEPEPVQEALCAVEDTPVLETPSLDDLSTAAAMSSELPAIKTPIQDYDVPEKASEVKEELPSVTEEAKSPEPSTDSLIMSTSSDAAPVKEESVKEESEVETKVEEPPEEQSDQDATQVTEEESPVATAESAVAPEAEEETPSPSGKKEVKKKKLSKKVGRKLLGAHGDEKDSKLKSKKRLKMEGGPDWDNRMKSSDLKMKSKKLKKSKNKKRFLRHDDNFGDKKSEDSEQPDKMKRREKKRSDKKFLKGKGDDDQLAKKKKNKKNKKELFDKKTKKKRKLQLDEETDSERESVLCKKRKRKKFQKAKEENSSSEEEGREKLEPDMAFLLCEEKVLASDLAEEDDSSSSEGGPAERTVLDNTPPTTPSSTESSSPPHPFAAEGFGGGGRASEEYRAAATLAFAVGKSPVVASSSGIKRSKGPDTLTGKRKKRMMRFIPDQPGKSPKHKTTYPRAAKVDNYCEDSSGTSCSPPYNSMTSPRPAPSSRLSADIRHSCLIPLQEKDPEKRIAYLQEKMAALRKKYLSLRAEVVAIDHKRRKARKKVREAAGMSANTSLLSEDGPSCS